VSHNIAPPAAWRNAASAAWRRDGAQTKRRAAYQTRAACVLARASRVRARAAAFSKSAVEESGESVASESNMASKYRRKHIFEKWRIV